LCRLGYAVDIFPKDAGLKATATEKTVLTALIDNCLKEMLRAEKRYRFHVVQYEDEMEPEYAPDDIEHLGIDLRLAAENFLQQECLVCAALQAGHSKNAIAAQLGCGWHTVDRVIESVRKRLEAMKMGGADDE